MKCIHFLSVAIALLSTTLAVAQPTLAGDSRYPRLTKVIKGEALGKVMISSDAERIAFLNDDNLQTWDKNTIDSGYYYSYKQSARNGFQAISPNLKWFATVIAPFTPWPSGQKKGKTQDYNVRLQTTEMKKAPPLGSLVPVTQYELVENLFPLAITNEGKVITADVEFSYKKAKYEEKKGTLKSAKNMYIGDPATGEKKLIYSGEMIADAPATKWNVTPDGKLFVLWSYPMLTSIDLGTGVRKDISTAQLNIDPRFGCTAFSNEEALFDKRLGNTFTYQWINLRTGIPTAPKELPMQQDPQFIGEEAWLYNEKDAVWSIMKRVADSLAIVRTVLMDRYNMGLPPTGNYQFVVFKGEKVVGLPTGGWNSYGRDMGKTAIVSYNLQKGKVDKTHYEVFANYYPGDGNANPVATSVSSMPSSALSSPANTGADCAQKIKSLSYPVGSKFTVSGSLTESWYEIIITGYDCSSNQYIAARRKFTDAKKSFFKTDANVSFYTVERVTYPGNTSFSHLPRDGSLYTICGMCLGASIVSEEVVHTRGGSWEQVNFNIEVYTPLHVIAAWKERAPCSKCNHTGLRKK